MNPTLWIITVGLFLFVDDTPNAAPATELVEPAVLTDAEGDKWLKRLRAVVPAEGWNVTRDGDLFVIETMESVELKNYIGVPAGSADEPPEAKQKRKREGVFKRHYAIRLRFVSKLAQDDYDRLAAINLESARHVDELRKDLTGIPRAKLSYSPDNRQQEARLRKFNAAVRGLPYHELPECFSADFSVFYGDNRYPGIEIFDSAVREECEHVEGSVRRLFGSYDPRIANGERWSGWSEDPQFRDMRRGLVEFSPVK
ncbi:MAG: hypothetical protein EXS05_08255 [Planctomycetaceae bacterium]|nr:hypothetical protein [Planctomycetaceae bacterium]